MYRIFRVIPFITFLTACIVLLADMIIFYQMPQYGKGENANNILLETYLAGDNQPTHPSVYDFGKKWNGWRYWMAYSPYPYGNGEEENPCIAVSNDLANWTIPNGLHNPIAFNEETSCDELKDPHIVYNSRTDSLEVWYLGRFNGTLAKGDDLLLMRKTTKNGIDWSRYEIIDTVNGTLSPSVIFKDDKYIYWTIKPSTETGPGKLLYSESFDRKHWTELSPCMFDGKSTISKIWHGAVSSDSIFRFVFVESSSNGNKITYAESRDGVIWNKPIPIIHKGSMRHHFYRPCILASNDSIYCFYATIDHENRWGLAMSSGKDYESLNKITVPNEFNRTVHYYYLAAKKSLHRIPLVKLCFFAALTSFIIGLITMNFSIIWGFSWCLSYIFIQSFSSDSVFSSCITLLCVGAFTLITSLSSIGLKALFKHKQ